MKPSGQIHIYTGNGKGKTTAALGCALRAMGAGMRVYLGQFMKKGHFSEVKALKVFQGQITIEQFGRTGFYTKQEKDRDKQTQYAVKGLKKAGRAMLSGKYDVVILDEINIAVHFSLLRELEVLSLIERKPQKVELILTGRYAPPSLIACAHLVSEIQEVKHYYKKGVAARKGIEK